MEDRNRVVPASYLIPMDGERILLLRRFNTGYEDGNYSFIAGHVERGESFTRCIIREAWEEAGITVREEDLRILHVMHRNSGAPKNNERVDVFFAVTEWGGQITNGEPEKCDDLSWFPMDDLPANTIPYIRQVVEGIRSREFYSETGWEG